MSSGDDRPSERETIPSGTSEPRKLCGFLSIPRELRDMVYLEPIASGHTAILRVSQQVHDEAKDTLYKHGICRLRFSCYGRSDDLAVLDAPDSPPNDAKNFNLRIDIPCFLNSARRYDPDLQHYVQGTESCHVTLVYETQTAMSLPTPVFRLIERLSTFKLVTVRIHFKFIYHPLDRRNGVQMRPPHEAMLGFMSNWLSPSLGDPEWKTEPYHGFRDLMPPRPPINPFANAQFLEFHPPKGGEPEAKPGPTVLPLR